MTWKQFGEYRIKEQKGSPSHKIAKTSTHALKLKKTIYNGIKSGAKNGH